MNNRNTIQGWNFSNLEINNAIKSRKLLNPSMDFTNMCNLNCIYCYIEDVDSLKKQKKNNETTFDQKIQIIKSFKALGAKTINIVGSGEPLLDPCFHDLINFIDSLSMNIVLFTNGTNLYDNKSLIDFLFIKKVSIIIKLNSFIKEKQDFLVGKQGYSVIRDNVIKLLIEKGFNKSNPTRLGVDTIAMNLVKNELIKIHKYCRDNNIFPLMSDYIPAGRTMMGRFQKNNAPQINNILTNEIELQPLSSDIKQEVISQITSLDKEYNILHNNKQAYYCGAKCSQILGLYVDIKGDIYPCIAKMRTNSIQNNTDGKLGNISDGETIEEIWKRNDYISNILMMYNGACPYK